jgi:hypothetical protein
MHEFISTLGLHYRNCLHCGKRKSLVCKRCRYCYECHPISEQIEAKPDKSYFAISNLRDIVAR